MAHHIIRHANLKVGDLVLDYGCAKGYLVKALRILGIRAYGCDISEYAISCVDDDVKDFCKLVEGDGTIPFDVDFDLVVAKDTLEHLTDEQLEVFLHSSRSRCSKAFHIIPMGDDEGKFIVPEYELDVTHVIRQPKDWWVSKFESLGWRLMDFRHSITGIKDVWTSRYPNGNGFFLLDSKPVFSLLMPTKDRFGLIAEAVAAIEAQTFREWELVIRDASISLVSPLLPEDKRINYRYMPGASFVEQMESCFADANGYIMNLCADDDLMRPTTLMRVNSVMGDRMWMYGQVQRSDNGDRMGDYWNFNKCKRINIVPTPAAFWRREAQEIVGIMDASIECCDWDYWLRLGARWVPLFIEEIFSDYRIHPDMISVTRVGEADASIMRIRKLVSDGHYDIISNSGGALF